MQYRIHERIKFPPATDENSVTSGFFVAAAGVLTFDNDRCVMCVCVRWAQCIILRFDLYVHRTHGSVRTQSSASALY